MLPIKLAKAGHADKVFELEPLSEANRALLQSVVKEATASSLKLAETSGSTLSTVAGEIGMPLVLVRTHPSSDATASSQVVLAAGDDAVTTSQVQGFLKLLFDQAANQDHSYYLRAPKVTEAGTNYVLVIGLTSGNGNAVVGPTCSNPLLVTFKGRTQSAPQLKPGWVGWTLSIKQNKFAATKLNQIYHRPVYRIQSNDEWSSPVHPKKAGASGKHLQYHISVDTSDGQSPYTNVFQSVSLEVGLLDPFGNLASGAELTTLATGLQPPAAVSYYSDEIVPVKRLAGRSLNGIDQRSKGGASVQP